MSDTKAQVRAFIQNDILMGARTVAFGDADSFIEHHVVDSTGFLELIGFLEDTYGIVVDDEEMVPENLDSLDAIEAYVARKKG